MIQPKQQTYIWSWQAIAWGGTESPSAGRQARLVLNSYQFIEANGEAQIFQHGDEDDYLLFVGGDGAKHVGQLLKALLQMIDI